MKYQDLEYLVAQPRLNRYLIGCGNSKSKAQKLYKANLRIAQSFYPILNLFEVILRNTIHYELTTHFKNSNWIIREKKGFMNHRSLGKSKFYLKNQVQTAERKVKKLGKIITTDQIIAEQTLGFWTSLFMAHHYRLIGGSVINCFPNKPTRINRASIYKRLKLIQDFRNRIYHNEPICFNGNTIDFQNAENVKTEIFNLLEWMNIDAKLYVETYDNIDGKIAIGKRI